MKKTCPRILFVEDHEDTRLMITALLRPVGYEVVAVEGVREALNLARSAGFDLYLLDSRYADGSGAELCEKIREFDETTPILFYSGEHPSRLREQLDCHVQGFVMKPGLDTLSQEINRALAS